MVAVRHLRILNSKFLMPAVKGHILHHYTELCEDRTSFRRDINLAIFLFSNMAAAAILNFQKFEILTASRLYGVNMRHRAKFRKWGSVSPHSADHST